MPLEVDSDKRKAELTCDGDDLLHKRTLLLLVVLGQIFVLLVQFLQIFSRERYSIVLGRQLDIL